MTDEKAREAGFCKQCGTEPHWVADVKDGTATCTDPECPHKPPTDAYEAARTPALPEDVAGLAKDLRNTSALDWDAPIGEPAKGPERMAKAADALEALPAEIEALRGALEQINTVCVDNAASTVNHQMALDFVRQVAEAALKRGTDDA